MNEKLKIDGHLFNSKPNIQKHAKSVRDTQENEEIFKYVHPSLDDEAAWKVHNEVKRLVRRQGIQEICRYLKELAAEDSHFDILKKIDFPKIEIIGLDEIIQQM